MRRVTITIQILSSRTAQRVSKNLEAFCKYQVMFQLRQRPAQSSWLTAHAEPTVSFKFDDADLGQLLSSP